MCPDCGGPLARPDGQCITCHQSSQSDAAQAYAPRSVWFLMLDAFRHRNYHRPQHANGATDDAERAAVAFVELDHARYLEPCQSPEQPSSESEV